MIYRAISTFILVFFISLGVFAQEKPSWMTDIENHITKNEKDWKIEKGDEQIKENSYNYEFFIESEKNRARVFIWQLKTVPNLAETFAGFVVITENSMLEKFPKTELKDFGDEGFIWKKINENGTSKIQFRKKDVFVELSASSEETARKIAKYIVEKLP